MVTGTLSVVVLFWCSHQMEKWRKSKMGKNKKNTTN